MTPGVVGGIFASKPPKPNIDQFSVNEALKNV